MTTEDQHKIMDMMDRIKMCGKVAWEEFKRLCNEKGISDYPFIAEYTPEHLEVCQEVWNKWHTTNNFKVGDKVYVVPLTPTIIPHCIRAVVTEISTDGWGYRLRAFRQDLPGIYMFNIWDKDLIPRVGKANKPTPPELYIGDA